jgi:hypothetical protein
MDPGFAVSVPLPSFVNGAPTLVCLISVAIPGPEPKVWTAIGDTRRLLLIDGADPCISQSVPFVGERLVSAVEVRNERPAQVAAFVNSVPAAAIDFWAGASGAAHQRLRAFIEPLFGPLASDANRAAPDFFEWLTSVNDFDRAAHDGAVRPTND